MRSLLACVFLIGLTFEAKAIGMSAVLFSDGSTPPTFTVRLEPKRILADEIWYLDGDCMGRLIRGGVVTVQINNVIADFSVHLTRNKIGAQRIICAADPYNLPPALRDLMPPEKPEE